MASKLLNQNCQYINRSSFRGLTDNELDNPNQIKERNEFDIIIAEKFGASNKPEDLSSEYRDVGNPYLLLYEDNNGGETSPVPYHEGLEDDIYD